jgi:hypothetical protein
VEARQPRAMTRRGIVARHEHATSRAPRPPMTHTRSGRAPTRARECRSLSHRRDVAPADSPRRRSQPPAGAESARPMTRCPPTGQLPAATRSGACAGRRHCAPRSSSAGGRWTRRRGAPLASASGPSPSPRVVSAPSPERPHRHPCWAPEGAVTGRDRHPRCRRHRWSPSHPLAGRRSTRGSPTGRRRR